MKDMTVETLNFIILCMGLLFVMAGILLIVGKLAGKRLASIAFGVLMIAWGFSAASPNYGGCSHAPPTWKHTGGHVGGARWRRPDACLHLRTVAHGRNRHNGGRPSMTSIDGLFAILEDRGLMPAVALFSLSAVLGLLYLSSGNLKTPNPHLRQDVDARHSMRSDMARLPIRGMTLNRAWTAYLPRFPVTRVPR